MAEQRRTTLDRDPHWLHRRRRDRERGAVIVEAAFIFPVLVLLVLGAIEYGFVFRDLNKLTTAARTAARVGTADKDPNDNTKVNADDDYQILQTVYTALGSEAANVEYVTVFDATAANGVVPAACSGTSPVSVAGVCNVYSGADLSLPEASIVGVLDTSWPPSSRNLGFNGATTEPDYIGVYIQAKHNYLTGIFGSSRDLDETAVFRYEPSQNASRRCTAPCGWAPQPTVTTTTTTTIPTTTTTTLPTTTTTTKPTTTTTTKPTTTTTKPTTTTTKAGGTTTTKPTTTTTKPTTTTAGPTTTKPTTTTVKPTTTTTAAPTTTIPTTTTTVWINPS